MGIIDSIFRRSIGRHEKDGDVVGEKGAIDYEMVKKLANERDETIKVNFKNGTYIDVKPDRLEKKIRTKSKYPW